MSPENLFATVPAVTLPNGITVPSFQVGQHFCSKGEDGLATVSATAAPWVRINYHAAIEACKAAGLNLITELQALAIAHDVAQVAANWTSGTVGEGKLIQGLRKYTVHAAQAGDYVPADEDERRWFVLSNGERICDVAGNLFTWVFDNVQGDEQGLIAKPFAEDSASIATAPYPSMERGMGWRPDAGRDWSGHALVRGGSWGDGDNAGAFDLNDGWPGDDDDFVGFRCTK